MSLRENLRPDLDVVARLAVLEGDLAALLLHAEELRTAHSEQRKQELAWGRRSDLAEEAARRDLAEQARARQLGHRNAADELRAELIELEELAAESRQVIEELGRRL